MDRQMTHVVRLVDDLLDISRITSGKLELRRKQVLLADVVANAIDASRVFIEAHGHELVVETRADALSVEGDPERLTQIFANLLSNSAKYTPRGGRIVLTIEREGDAAVVKVADTGVGIPPEALEHVFEMFAQVGAHQASSTGGLGIGLALARTLVELHGGRLSAFSAGLGLGSTFTVHLPLAHAPAAASTAHEPAKPSERPGVDGRRVLVVDDNADAAQTLAYLIRALGENEVHVAHSGAEALPLAQRVKPDTVFLDLKMPEMDGYEVARRMRGEPWAHDAWLVALTGWGLDEHKRRSTEAGFNEHLTKPADRSALENILARNNGARVH
jgi:CheY-like chemotaxis protein